MPTAIGPEDVCVTGMAWTTPLGDTLGGVWDRLIAGDSGLRPTPSPHTVRNLLAATVPDLDLDLGPARRQEALATRTLAAGLADAGRTATDPGLHLVLGTSFGPLLDEPDNDPDGWADGSADRWAVRSARQIGYPGRPISVSTACSAGSDSILVATELIRSGFAEACVAGGVDVLTEAKRLGHTALGTMSPGLLRAFDERHDGMLLGEGAAVLVLESVGSARRRGAPILALLRGTGSANDAAGLTAPDPSGDSIVLAVERCLADAGRERADVAVISAHATGTPVNDTVETISLARLFADLERPPTVFATKGALGHSLGATGAIEAITVVLALRDGRVPAVHGLDTPVDGFALPLPAGGPRTFEGSLGASLTIGFGGFNTCLLFERAAS